VMDEAERERRAFQLDLHTGQFFQSSMGNFSALFFAAFVSILISSIATGNEYFLPLLYYCGFSAIVSLLFLYILGFQSIQRIKKKYITPLESNEVEPSSIDISVKPPARGFWRKRIGISLVSIILIVIISLVIYLPALEPLKSMISMSVLTTFLGLFIAFTLDRFIDYWEEKETLDQILFSILKELEMNIKDLNGWNFVKSQTYFSIANNSIFQSAIGGGYLSSMELETQKKLSRLYTNVNFITYMSDRILLVSGLGSNEEDAKYLLAANKKLKKDVEASITEHKEVIEHIRSLLA